MLIDDTAKIVANVAPKFGGARFELDVLDIRAEHREAIVLWLAGRGLKEVLEDAGAGDAAGFDKKLDSIKRGETPASRTRRDPVEVEMANLAMADVRAAIKKAGLKVPAERVKELAQERLEKNAAELRTRAEPIVAARRAAVVDIDLTI